MIPAHLFYDKEQCNTIGCLLVT